MSAASATQAPDAGVPIDLSDGTIEIADQQVVIRYAVDGQEREVAYDILPAE